MAIDPYKQQQLHEAAGELLRAKYTNGWPHLDPIRSMHAVRAATFEDPVSSGEKPPTVPAEDVLAALTQLAVAREVIDQLELDLLRAARARGASWQKIADHLGLARKQSAEGRLIRLERSKTHGDRYVGKQREERARQRNADEWCRTHEDRIRTVAQRVLSISSAWPELTDSALGSACLDGLVTAGDGPTLAGHLFRLRLIFAPYGLEPLEAVGEQRDKAAAIRDSVLDLVAELLAVRAAQPAPRGQ
ncbi:hypothetical protein [Streptomyces sp. NPDC088915]|uniref:hypothetical protein n=1 Tax=Streptomyces sp. NPDC088915 TaxID=3365912 RepID=UPI003826D2AB